MPRTRSLELGGERLVKEAVMASGLLVQDVIGFRTVLSAHWEWIPTDILTSLTELVRTGDFLEILYPDPVQGATKGRFKVEIGNAKIFKFMNGQPRWYNVDLKATAQEVK